MATAVIYVIGAAAVAFLTRFFVALCKDPQSTPCHVVHILLGLEEREVVRTWTGAIHSVPRAGAMAARTSTIELGKYRAVRGHNPAEEKQA